MADNLPLTVPQHPTEREKQIYDQLGLAPGDLLPANFDQLVKKHVPDADEELGDLAQQAPVTLAKKKLSPDSLRELQQAVRQAQQSADHINDSDYLPDVAQAIRRQREMRNAGAESNRPAAAETPNAEPEKAEESTPKTMAESETGLTANRLCPCCCWDLSRQDVVEVTEEDKTAFTPCWLGGLPFTRRYKLLDGKLTVEFRELGSEDRDHIRDYFIKGMQSGKITNLNATDMMTRFQFALQLISFVPETGVPVTLPRSIAEWQKLDPEKNPIEIACDYVFHTLVKYDSLQTALFRVAERFVDLTARLASMAHKDTKSF